MIKHVQQQTDRHQRPKKVYGDAPQQRLCLRCEQPFGSTWSGHRVCKKCQTSHAWKVA